MEFSQSSQQEHVSSGCVGDGGGGEGTNVSDSHDCVDIKKGIVFLH